MQTRSRTHACLRARIHGAHIYHAGALSRCATWNKGVACSSASSCALAWWGTQRSLSSTMAASELLCPTVDRSLLLARPPSSHESAVQGPRLDMLLPAAADKPLPAAALSSQLGPPADALLLAAAGPLPSLPL